MEAYEREDETLEILDQVVERTKTLGILGVVHVHQRSDLRSREGNVLVAAHDLQFLASNSVGWWPQRIVLLGDLGIVDDPLEFLHDGFVDAGLLSDHGVVLVVGVVGVSEFAIGPKLELKEFVTELAFVPDVITKIEIALHLLIHARRFVSKLYFGLIQIFQRKFLLYLFKQIETTQL